MLSNRLAQTQVWAGISAMPVPTLLYYGSANEEDNVLDNRQALNTFLAGIERRAFRMAELATSNPDAALDIVQDAMLALVKKYAHKGEDAWGPLFHRILQSKIRDWYRRNTVRNRIFSWFTHNDEDDSDPVQQAADVNSPQPDHNLHNDLSAEATMQALKLLPLRQQQAFMLRSWEGYSVEQTAQAMGCSAGSVKTHYSRAVHTLREQLEAYQS